MSKNSNISIFVGHFGSGKTEVAMNYSLSLAKQGIKTVLVDLDIINPFFRSTEMKDELEKQGVEVISPTFAASNMDLPALPSNIYSVFERKDAHIVFDVGGDEDGATVLGRYNPQFNKSDYTMHFVINIFRPFSNNSDDIIKLVNNIENHSRLKVTDLINNTNLSYETKAEHVVQGQKIIKEVSDNLKLPIKYVTAQEHILNELPKEYQDIGFKINRFMKPMWEQDK